MRVETERGRSELDKMRRFVSPLARHIYISKLCLFISSQNASHLSRERLEATRPTPSKAFIFRVWQTSFTNCRQLWTRKMLQVSAFGSRSQVFSGFLCAHWCVKKLQICKICSVVVTTHQHIKARLVKSMVSIKLAFSVKLTTLIVQHTASTIYAQHNKP